MSCGCAGTGRLWAVLIQLMYNSKGSPEGGGKTQASVFQDALREVPKSGEVVNPFTPQVIHATLMISIWIYP